MNTKSEHPSPGLSAGEAGRVAGQPAQPTAHQLAFNALGATLERVVSERESLKRQRDQLKAALGSVLDRIDALHNAGEAGWTEDDANCFNAGRDTLAAVEKEAKL